MPVDQHIYFIYQSLDILKQLVQYDEIKYSSNV